MAINSITNQTSYTTNLLPAKGSIKWDQYKTQEIVMKENNTSENVNYVQLQNTKLACSIDTESGQWAKRQLFIEKVFQKMMADCPKDEPLCFISLGSEALLMEYILGRSLIESGFKQITFLLVDPSYLYSSSEDLLRYREIFADFRREINSIYEQEAKEAFPADRIRFLSTAQNVPKYFPERANVVLLECLPPYVKYQRDIRKMGLGEVRAENLVSTGHIVPSEVANTISFIPRPYLEDIQKRGGNIRTAFPTVFFSNSFELFFLQWGCKIQTDGAFSFFSPSNNSFLTSINVVGDHKIELTPGNTILAKEWIPTLKKALEEKLSEKILNFKDGDSNKKLSQQNITELLKEVETTVKAHMSFLIPFFQTDYLLDRQEVLSYISSHASHHFCHDFIYPE